MADVVAVMQDAAVLLQEPGVLVGVLGFLGFVGLMMRGVFGVFGVFGFVGLMMRGVFGFLGLVMNIFRGFSGLAGGGGAWYWCEQRNGVWYYWTAATG